jgi:hypothetical protein
MITRNVGIFPIRTRRFEVSKSIPIANLGPFFVIRNGELILRGKVHGAALKTIPLLSALQKVHS